MRRKNSLRNCIQPFRGRFLTGRDWSEAFDVTTIMEFDASSSILANLLNKANRFYRCASFEEDHLPRLATSIIG